MKPVLEARGLTKKYMMGETEVVALDGVDFSVMPGEFVSIMGPSGSGKTTLLNLIGCIDRPTDGDMLVNGRSSSTLSDAELDRMRLRSIGFVFQRVNLIPILTARENVELPMELAGVAAEKRRQRADEMLECVGLAGRSGHKPSQLSAGEQQRVGIARSLVNSPEVILADEPTGNLDSKNASEIMSLLKKLNMEMGQTLIVVTHDPEVGRIAGRMIFIRDGRVDLSCSS